MATRIEQLRALLDERIVVLDGAWGVLLQGRGSRSRSGAASGSRTTRATSTGDPDLLNLTRPDVVESIHRAYLDAGADITTTNTFTATSIGQADYGLEHAVREMNVEAARLARQAADERGGFVAGSVGPLNVTLSLSPGSTTRPTGGSLRPRCVEAYAEQIDGARRGRRRPPPDRDDLRHAERQGRDRGGARGGAPDVPLWLSFTAVDQSGRNLSGQTSRGVLDLGRARRAADRRRQLLAGRREMRPFLEDLARVADTYVAPATRMPACRTRSASTTRRPRHEPIAAGVRRRRAWSTSSAAAAGRRPSTSGRSRRGGPAVRPGPSRAAAGRASAASSRSRSARTPASSWSASGRT